MHKIALGLVKEFTSQNLPVMFKYQLTTSENHCDRIIIYSDKEHNKQVENAIKAVYDKNMFDGDGIILKRGKKNFKKLVLK